MNKQAALYARVSTRAQGDDTKTSIQTQQAAMLEYARARDLIVAPDHIFTDIETGTTMDRAGLDALRAMLDAPHSPVKALICYDPDRFGRVTLDMMLLVRDLSRKGVAVHFVNMGRAASEEDLELWIRALFAQQEWGKIRERTIRGRIAAIERGNLGAIQPQAIPYGYNAGFTINEEQAGVVRRIFHWFVEDRYNTHKIATMLDALGIPPPRSKLQWWNSGINRMLKYRAYIGEYPYEVAGKRMILKVPPIIDEETFTRAGCYLKENKQYNLAHRSYRRPYLLAGMIECSTCHCTKYCFTRVDGHSYYRCPYKAHCANHYSRPYCDAKNVRTDRLDSEVWRITRAWLVPEEIAESLLALDTSQETSAAHAEQIQRQIQAVSTKAQNLAANLATLMQASADLPLEAMNVLTDQIARLNEQKQMLEGELQKAGQATDSQIRARLVSLAEDVAVMQDKLDLLHEDPEQLRRFLEFLGLHIILDPDGAISQICLIQTFPIYTRP